MAGSAAVIVSLSSLLCMATFVSSQVMPTGDPFSPPPMPPNWPNNWAPPPPPNFAPPPTNNGFGGFDLSQFANTISGGPQLPPVGPMSNNINQPMPPEAAHAGSYSHSSGVQEQEYEAGYEGGGGGGGGMSAHQNYNPPPASFPMQTGPMPSTSLLDAYYGRNPAQPASGNNDLFGGMFGGTPGGNLFGAYMINEYVF